MRYFDFNRAFTLAEVLITLGIIGVVAALTIPVMLQNTQKQELKSGLKEAYTMMSSAYNSLKADQGFMENYNAMYTYYRNTADPRQFATDLTSYLNVVQTCSAAFGCVDTSGTNSYGPTYTDFQGNSVAPTLMYSVGRYQYVLKNGMILFVYHPSGEGALWFSVDVNGFKRPNVLGKDVFLFNVTTSNVLIPRSNNWGGGTPSAGWGACDTSNCTYSRLGCPSAAFYDDNYWNLWQ